VFLYERCTRTLHYILVFYELINEQNTCTIYLDPSPKRSGFNKTLVTEIVFFKYYIVFFCSLINKSNSISSAQATWCCVGVPKGSGAKVGYIVRFKRVKVTLCLVGPAKGKR